MEHYFCIDISFPNVDFDKYFSESEHTPSVFHSHLYVRENEIELKILFHPSVHFNLKFSSWLGFIDLKKIGQYINVSAISPNQSLLKVSFSDSQLIGATSGSAQFEGDLQYYSIKLNTVKLYFQPSIDKLNTGDFYLSPKSFKVVSGFYSILFQNNDFFKIPRHKDRSDFYCIADTTFRPEFEFGYSDSVRSDIATIIKTPKIHFKYNNISEETSLFHSEVVRQVLSFYFHFKVEYTTSKLYCEDYTISIKKVYQNERYDKGTSGLFGFGIEWNLDTFLKANWQKQALKNYSKLFKAIELFNQSQIVDSSSCFLIQYNIIEVCMGGKKSTDPKFEKVISNEQVSEKYSEALNLLLQTVSQDDANDFKIKWEGIVKKMDFKPIKSPLETFFNEQNLPIDKFPISISKLKEIRDNLTHGSIKKVKATQLEKANMFLYRLSGILILNLLGIKDWSLNTEIKK